MTIKTITTILASALALTVFAQSESAYDPPVGSTQPSGNESTSTTPVSGLFDPSRLKISHSMGFSAGGSQFSDIKSQSMYSTMLQYKFNAPVVMSLNFDMPIHSTFNQYNNFTSDNLKSLDYFRNMPFDASIAWMPSEKLMLRVSVIKMPEGMGADGYYYNSFYRGTDRDRDRFYRWW